MSDEKTLRAAPSWPRVEAARAEITRLGRSGDRALIVLAQAKLGAAFTACRDEIAAAGEGREAGNSEGVEPAVVQPERARRAVIPPTPTIAIVPALAPEAPEPEPVPEPEVDSSAVDSDNEKTQVDRPPPKPKPSGAKKLPAKPRKRR